MTPEGKVKEEIKKVLDNTKNCWYFMPVPNGMGRAGIPDFIGCVGPYFFAIEAKSHTVKTTPWQDREIESIKICGASVSICRCGDDARRLLKELSGNANKLL